MEPSRLQQGNMECKVNGKTVIEFKDDRLKPGGLGLVKFRSPSAEFRNFRFGPELTDSTIPRRLTTKVNKSEDLVLRSPPSLDAKLQEQLLENGPRVPDILRSRARRLEEESAQLKS